jgi:hypothetical protein
VKHRNLLLIFISIVTSVAFLFSACKKLNESTEVGGGLIPAVDNIHTFETYLDVVTDNKLFQDTSNVIFSDFAAVGDIPNDPEFGPTHANAYFNIGSSYTANASAAIPNTYYPFINRDSVVIDSVILSLSYTTFFGDTNSFQTLRVFEIAQNAGFDDSSFFRYTHSDFLTTGPQLGSKTFQISHLKDSILHIRQRDTTILANVIRIPLQNSLGTRFALYDTSNSISGGFRTDSIFRRLFRGLAIKADNGGNGLTYFSPSDHDKTKLTVYFRVTKNGVIDTTSTDFYHQNSGQANAISRTPQNGWLSYLSNGLPSDDKVYLQSTPGSYASITIPGLDTFKNAIIHRAELVVPPLSSAQDAVYAKPLVLFLDRINNTTADTVSTFDVDMGVQASGLDFTYNLSYFGGAVKSDTTYRFNISRYVQDIITLKYPNQTLRLYAPVRAFVFSKLFNRMSQITVANQAAYGRVVLGGGNYAIPAKRIRLRIVYSKL